MSKYLDKQALLKWLEQRYRENHEEFEVDRSGENLKIINEIKSGTFNADESEPDDYESMVLLDAYGQIQRLRAALEQLIEDYKRRIRSAITMIEDPGVRVEQKTRIQVKKRPIKHSSTR